MVDLDLDLNAVYYGLDGHDRICCVDNNWVTFAKANGAPELSPELVVGKSLWHFVKGRETVDLTRVIFDKVRLTEAAFVIPFSCDSPTETRSMVMLVKPGAGKFIEISTRTVLDPIEKHLHHHVPMVDRVGQMLKVCAWCCRIELITKMWVEVEYVIGDLGALSTTYLPSITHGICPDCFDLVRATAFI